MLTDLEDMEPSKLTEKELEALVIINAINLFFSNFHMVFYAYFLGFFFSFLQYFMVEKPITL